MRQITGKQAETMDAIKAGSDTRALLARRLKIPLSSCNNRVRRLINLGLVREYSYGEGPYKLEVTL